MLNLRKVASGLAIAGLFGCVATASATTINAGFVPGIHNQIQDESREAYVDANGNGNFDVGDVIFGYVQINNFAQSGLNANNAVYGVFSQQITSIVGSHILFGTTTVAGLTLDALTGNANTAGGIAAFYDKAGVGGYGTDLITTPVGGATGMKDYIDFITAPTATLRLVAGFATSPAKANEFLASQSDLAGAANSNFINLPDSVTVAATSGGLSVLFNHTNFTYSSTETSNTPWFLGGISGNDYGVSISGGSVSGAGTGTTSPVPNAWLNADYGAFDFKQCSNATSGDVKCGFTDKNNFGLTPIPEPGTLALVALSLIGLGFAGRRRS